jgi:hypothetical protein
MKPEKPEPDAGQLLKMLEMQAEMKRSARASRDTGRNTFRIFSLVIILAVTAGALFALQMMLSQLPRPEKHDGVAQPARP